LTSGPAASDQGLGALGALGQHETDTARSALLRRVPACHREAERHNVPMDHVTARAFVDSWVTAWNAHDVDTVLTHFAGDVTFRSPVAVHLLAGDGVIRGKDALRAYWAEGLRRIPDLRFEVLGSYVGVDCLVINYRNQKGGLVNEVLIFDGSLVAEGYGTYLGEDANPAGAR
jgi:hypothetical protein